MKGRKLDVVKKKKGSGKREVVDVVMMLYAKSQCYPASAIFSVAPSLDFLPTRTYTQPASQPDRQRGEMCSKKKKPTKIGTQTTHTRLRGTRKGSQNLHGSWQPDSHLSFPNRKEGSGANTAAAWREISGCHKDDGVTTLSENS